MAKAQEAVYSSQLKQGRMRHGIANIAANTSGMPSESGTYSEMSLYPKMSLVDSLLEEMKSSYARRQIQALWRHSGLSQIQADHLYLAQEAALPHNRHLSGADAGLGKRAMLRHMLATMEYYVMDSISSSLEVKHHLPRLDPLGAARTYEGSLTGILEPAESIYSDYYGTKEYDGTRPKSSIVDAVLKEMKSSYTKKQHKEGQHDGKRVALRSAIERDKTYLKQETELFRSLAFSGADTALAERARVRHVMASLDYHALLYISSELKGRPAKKHYDDARMYESELRRLMPRLLPGKAGRSRQPETIIR
jgi:hypothetical protein